MLWNEWNSLTFIIHSYSSSGGFAIFVECCTCKTITQSIRQLVVERTATQRCFQTTRMALTRIGHHTAKSVVVCQYRQLLITDLHIESSQVELHLSAH